MGGAYYIFMTVEKLQELQYSAGTIGECLQQLQVR